MKKVENNPLVFSERVDAVSMNEYYSGDVGKCPFATAAHAREVANVRVSIAALKQFGNLIVNGVGYLLGAGIALILLAAAIALMALLCAGANPISIVIVAG